MLAVLPVLVLVVAFCMDPPPASIAPLCDPALRRTTWTIGVGVSHKDMTALLIMALAHVAGKPLEVEVVRCAYNLIDNYTH